MRIFRTIIIALVAFGLTLHGAAAVAAQDATAAATPNGPSEGYPVAIHAGTCDEPTAEPAWQLDDAVSVGVNQEEEPEVLGESEIRTISGTSGDLDVSLDDLTGSQHVIAIHASPDEFGTLAACGNIGGILEDGRLVVAVTAIGDSAVYGVAIFEENGDQTTATVYIVPPSNDKQATPAA